MYFVRVIEKIGEWGLQNLFEIRVNEKLLIARITPILSYVNLPEILSELE